MDFKKEITRELKELKERAHNFFQTNIMSNRFKEYTDEPRNKSKTEIQRSEKALEYLNKN